MSEDAAPDRRERARGPFPARRLALLALAAAAAGVAIGLGILATRPLVGDGPAGQAGQAVAPGSGFYVLGAAGATLRVGEPIPELAAPLGGTTVAVTDLDGRPLSLAAYRGRPLWIVFWATWCPPCRREAPDLQATWAAHRDGGLVLLAVSVKEPPETVRAYAAEQGLTYPIGLDTTGAVVQRFGVFGLPTHFFVDREGILRDLYLGPLTREAMERRLERIGG